MEITMNHMVYDLIEIASSGGMPNEFKITNEQAQYWIEQTRAILIGQSLNKKDDVNDSWIQYLNCIPLERVDASECCDIPLGCYLLKSVQQLPTTIDTYKDNWILSVTTLDGTSISKSNPIKQRYQKYNKYTKNERSWYLKDNYLYIINETFLEKANVSGIFEFPSDLSRFVTCSGDSCWTADSKYPITISMASQITDFLVKTKIQPFMSFPMDDSNNMNGATPKQNLENKQSE